MADKKLSLSLSAEAREELLRQGFDPAYGARPLKKCVQKLIEDEIAELFLKGELDGAKGLEIDAEDGKMKIEVLL